MLVDSLGDAEGALDTDGVSVDEGEALTLEAIEGVFDIVEETVAEGVTDGVMVRLEDVVGDMDWDGNGDGVAIRVTVDDRELLGVTVTVEIGVIEVVGVVGRDGVRDEVADGDGESDGETVIDSVSVAEGAVKTVSHLRSCMYRYIYSTHSIDHSC